MTGFLTPQANYRCVALPAAQVRLRR
jgi:hypothetical protein